MYIDGAFRRPFICGKAYRIADLGSHAQTHALQHGHDLGEIQWLITVIDFHAADAGLEIRAPHAGAHRLAGRQAADGQKVGKTLFRLEVFLVRDTELSAGQQ